MVNQEYWEEMVRMAIFNNNPSEQELLADMLENLAELADNEFLMDLSEIVRAESE